MHGTGVAYLVPAGAEAAPARACAPGAAAEGRCRMLALGRIKKQAALGALVLTLILGVVGTLFFLLALRPCRMRISPGSLVTWNLRVESRALPAEAQVLPRVETRAITLLGIGEGGRSALITPGAPGTRDEVALTRLREQGGLDLLDAAERAMGCGKAVGFFDFNLLQLPRGSEQEWDVSLSWSSLPPGRRDVQCRVRRLENGLRPVFRLQPRGTIEWTDPDDGGAYRQIRDLTCKYAFNHRLGLVDWAELRFTAARETATGVRRHEVVATLELGDSVDRVAADAVALGDLAVATVQVQDLLAGGRLDALRPHLATLRRHAVDHPRLRALVEALERDASAGVVPRRPVAGGWWLQVGTAPAARRAEVERLVRDLAGEGYPAGIRARPDGTVRLLLGPYAERDERLPSVLRLRIPSASPAWVRE